MATATIIQATRVIPYKSSGGNAKGDIVSTGNRISVCLAAIAAGATGPLAIDYIADFPNTLGTTIADGIAVTWDGTTIQTTLTTGVPLGVMVQAQASADTTARVSVVASGDALQVANVAALTDNSGGTASGTLAAVGTVATSGGNTYADSAINAKLVILGNAVASLAAKQAAVLTALKNAGIQASS